MTGAAVCGGDIRGVADVEGFVCLMTLFTVGLQHGRTVGFVAVGAVGDVAMFVFVAGGTCQDRMFTRKILQLRPLTLVTGQTGGGEIFTENDLQRPVGIFVTAETSFNLIVGGAAMTLTASRYYFQRHRGVTRMTILTTDAVLMRLTGFLNIPRRITMAFDAIVVDQHRCLSLCNRRQSTACPAKRRHHQGKNCHQQHSS